MDKLTELTEAYEKLGKEIEALKSPKPWEPKRYEYVASQWNFGYSDPLDRYTEISQTNVVRSGRSYPTREDAEKASKFFIFYQRLYTLAFELNQKYEDTRNINDYRYYVYIEKDEGYWFSGPTYSQIGSEHVFTSSEAAQEAADIMNRDGWKLPKL